MRIGKSGLLLRLAGIAAPCILLACQSETTAPQTLVSPLIPLRVGTTFSYHSTDTLIGAVSSSDSAAPDSDFTLRVVSEVADYTGRRWASLDAPVRMFGSAQYASFIFTNAADGLRSVWSSYPVDPLSRII